MASEIRNALFIASLFPQKTEESSEKTGSGRLKEPRDLYSAASLQHPPKWPIECQVIPEKVKHVDIAPTKPESFYVTNNTEPQPRPVGEEMGTVIYDYKPKLSVDYFCRSCVGGSEDLQAFEADACTLKFESRFESGNLAKVIKVTNVYYELYLRPDMYTDRHAQWYYFRIQNTKEGVLYRFSIVNLNKPDSLYRYGLKPLVYSEKNSKLNRVGWVRSGQNISYYKNDITCDENTASYTLTFNLKFRHNNDTVYIAQCYPYTYSKLQNYLKEIESDKFRSQLCQQRLLCKSLAGNNVYVLTITSPENEEVGGEEEEKKPAVVLSARVHPGETPSSYMMKGIIDFLISDCSQAQELRDRFIFKLIPMLNPDGVIVGNSRCCLLGQDLNRQYCTVLREAFPQIYHTKVLLRRLAEENGVFMYCDIHGHSRRNNVFIYGCENRRIPEKRLTEQVFPLMMHKNAADKFSFQNCKFKIQKSKEGTGRIFAWTLGIGNSYTLEISLCGSTMVSRQHTHFNTEDFEGLGRHFCETLLDYSDNDPTKEKIRERILQKLMEGGSTADEPVNIPITDYSSLSHSETEESDTTEDDEEIESKKAKASVKRQTSIRCKKAIKRAALRTERASINLSTASVEFIRLGQKERRVTTTEENIETIQEKELIVTNRLRSFRRSRLLAIHERQKKFSTLFSPKKCSKLLFDDPFNPPPTRQGSDEAEENGDTGTQTEDECDYLDSAMTNEIYLTKASQIAQELTAGLNSLQLGPPTLRKVSSFNTTTTNLTTLRFSKGNADKDLGEERRIKSMTPFVSLPRRAPSQNFERRCSLATTSSGRSQDELEGASKRLSTSTSRKNQLKIPEQSKRRVSWAGGFSSNTSVMASTSTSVTITEAPVKKKTPLNKARSVGSKQYPLLRRVVALEPTQEPSTKKKEKRKTGPPNKRHTRSKKSN